MKTRLSASELDDILALQFSVAWAGEAAGDPARLGWWKTDLVDREGGGDLFARLVPRTAAWASLSLARKAARRIDEAARSKLAKGDSLWTPFHFGFFVDEQLEDRIAYHRTHEHVPSTVLGSNFVVGNAWSASVLAESLSALAKPKVQVEPGGRRVAARAQSAVEAAPLVFAALVPFAERYPLPFVEAAV